MQVRRKNLGAFVADWTATFLLLGAAGFIGGGCGGGSSGGASAQTVALEGTAVDGRVRNGAGEIFSIAADGALTSIGTIATDNRGDYTFDLPAGFVGPIRLRLTSGEYTDGATGLPVNLSASSTLEAVANANGAPLTVHLTPFTTVAALLLDTNPPASFDAGAITAINDAVREAFALPGDLTALRPLDLSDPADAAAFAADPAAPEAQYGLLVGALAQVAAGAPGGALSVSALAAALAADAADGVLDGATNGTAVPGLAVDSATAGLAAGVATFLTQPHIADTFTDQSLPAPDPDDPAVTDLQGTVASNPGTVPLPENPDAPTPTAIAVAGLAQGFINQSTGTALDVTVDVGDLALVGDVVTLSVIDTAGTAPVTASHTLTVAGAQTIPFAAVDVASLVDAELRYRARATRGATDSPFIATTAQKDVTAPTAQITAPTDGDFVAGVLDATATATDNRTLAQVQFTLDDGTSAPVIVTDLAAPFEAALATAGLADGAATLTVVATDAAGNTASASIAVAIDNTAPSGDIDEPAANDFVAGTFTAEASADDGAGSGVAEVRFTLTQGASTATLTSTSGPHEASFDTIAGGFADGDATLSVEAEDVLGNAQSIGSITVQIDNTPPTATITAPLANSFQPNAVAATATAADGAGSSVAEVRFTLSQASGTPTTLVATGGSLTVTFADTATLGLAEGPTTLTVATLDNVGNEDVQAATVDFQIDRSPPTGTVTLPQSGDFVRGTFTVASSDVADAGVGVASVLFRFEQGTNVLTATVTQAPFSTTFDSLASGFVDGAATVEFTATDALGHAFDSAPVTMTIDNGSPSVTAIQQGGVTLVDDQAVQTLDEVAILLADSGSGPDSAATTIEITRDGTLLVAGTDFTRTDLATSIEIEFTPNQDGTYAFSVTPADAIGNLGAPFALTVFDDSELPTGTITQPAGAFIGTAPTVAATADDNVALASVTFTASDSDTPANEVSLTVTGAGPTFQGSLDLSGFVAGNVTLRIDVIDSAGNVATGADSKTYTLDLQDPTGTITAPANNAAIGGAAVFVEADVADDVGVASITFTLIDSLGATVTTQIAGNNETTQTLSGTIDATSLTDGAAGLTLSVTDVAGNVVDNADGISVTIDNVAPTVAEVRSGGLVLIDGQHVAALPSLTIVLDDVGVGVDLDATGVTIARDGVSLVVAADFTRTNSTTADEIEINFTPQVDGVYSIVVTPADLAGNTGTFSFGVTVDSVPPTGQIVSPAPGTFHAGSVFVVASATDTRGVASVQFEIVDANSNNIATTVNASPFEATLSLSGFVDGDADVRIVISDGAGNTASDTIAIVIDQSEPLVAILAPNDGDVLSGSVDVSASATDLNLALVTFTLSDGTTNLSDSATSGVNDIFETDFDTTGLADGLANLTVLAEDAAGNFDFKVIQVVIDNTAPVFDAANSTPQDGDLLNTVEGFTANFFAFRFQDANLDTNAIAIEVTLMGQPLVENTGSGGNYVVDRTTQANTIFVTLQNLPPPQAVAGDPLVFEITNLADLAGNAGANATVAVTLDRITPSAFALDFLGRRNSRVLVQFDEAMTADDSGLAFFDANNPGAGNFVGEGGFRTIDNANDLYFFVPYELIDVGAMVRIDLSGFRDRAGNDVGNPTIGPLPVGPGFGGGAGGPPIDQILFVDTSGPTSTVLATIDPSVDVVNGAFIVPETVAGTEAEVHVVFALDVGQGEELSPFGFAGIEGYQGDEETDFSVLLGTTSSTNDTLVVNEDGSLTFRGTGRYLLDFNVNTNRGRFGNAAIWFIVLGGAGDTTPPAITALVGPANAAPGSPTIQIRPEEPLVVGLSEPVQLPALESGVTVTVEDGSGAVVDVGFVDADSESPAFAVRRVDPATGALLPWAIGDYTIEFANIPDARTTPNLLGSAGPLAFVVGANTSTPVLVASQPHDGADQADGFQVHLQFDTAMADASFVDTGDPTLVTQGFRLEEEVLDRSGNPTGIFVPKRGLRVGQRFNVLEPFATSDVVSLTDRLGVGVLQPGMRYVLTLLEATSIDGEPVASGTELEFTIAEHPQVNQVVINEFDPLTAGADGQEFIELSDGGPAFGGGNRSLNGLVLAFFAADTGEIYEVFDLFGHSTDGNGLFVVGNAGVNGASVTFSAGTLDDGPGAVAVLAGSTTDFATGTLVSVINPGAVVDAVVYDGSGANAALSVLLDILTPGQAALPSDTDTVAYARKFDGAGGNRRHGAFELRAPTPGDSNGFSNVRPQINGGDFEVQVVVDDTIEVDDGTGLFVEVGPFLEASGFWNDANSFQPGQPDSFTYQLEVRAFPGGSFTVLDAGGGPNTNFFFEADGDDVTRGATSSVKHGINEVRLTVTDAAGADTSFLRQVYVPLETSLGQATAVVQVDRSVQVSGSIAAVDGPRVSAVQLLVLPTDGNFGANGLRIETPPVYTQFAQIVRAADGTLTYTGTVPADALVVGKYTVLCEVTFPQIFGGRGGQVFAITPPSAPFDVPTP